MGKYHWEHTSLRFLVGCFPYYWTGCFMYEPTFNIYCTVLSNFTQEYTLVGYAYKTILIRKTDGHTFFISSMNYKIYGAMHIKFVLFKLFGYILDNRVTYRLLVN